MKWKRGEPLNYHDQHNILYLYLDIRLFSRGVLIWVQCSAAQRSVLDQIKLTKTETKIKPYLSFCLRINITRTLSQSYTHMDGLRRNKNSQRQ